MILYIAEKPAVAQDIADALGKHSKKDGFIECENGDVITWCYGHILQSKAPEEYNESYKTWKIEDLPLKLFPVQLKPSPKTTKQVKIILDLIKKSDVIVNAGDCDDEGQLLVDEVILYSGSKKPVKRLLINDNTQQAIKKSLSKMEDNKNFIGLYNRALARSVADEIYGLSMTRNFTVNAQKKGFKGVLSIGRVQTPVLGLICQRYLDNTNHKESYFQSIQGKFDGDFIANWQVSIVAPVDEKKRLIDEQFAKDLCKKLTKQDFTVTANATTNKESAPPLPFNLLKLQQEMSKKHKFTAKKTLELTQELRENFKAITYNRSDCQYLSDEQFSEAPALLNSLKQNYPGIPFDQSIKSKAFDTKNVTAHTAIIPTLQIPKPGSLTKDQEIVYNAICERYIMQFLQPLKYEEINISLSHDDEIFTKRAKKIIDKGFTQFFNDEDKEESETDSLTEDSNDFDVLTKISIGQKIHANDVYYKNIKTTPPPIFTESSLLNAFTRVADFVTDPKIKKLLKDKDKGKKGENGGIGTPATRDSFVPKLQERGFIKIEKQKIIPTDLGLQFFNSLPKEITSPDLTALWSEKQVDIENGSLTVEQFVNQLYDDIELLIGKSSVDVKFENKPQFSALKVPCPNCQKQILVKDKVFTCEDTKCNFTIWKTISSKKITNSDAEALIKKGKTSLIKGFTSKAGKPFDAFLKMDDSKTAKITFEFETKK